ncbi:MAG: ParB/RepB/Spo0J family partition protein [Candidatus Aminicenantes bacterium]|nr:ParB/RepB/Spo0J family partition protein [Candidatus Aminicenantes bacterium]
MNNYQEITLSRISSNPHNPRKSFLGPAFDELVASIREKGIIEPIILRPTFSGKKDYEVVAGERRFKAACQIAEENNGLEHARISAIIRELSDEEAFDFMIIENLQREDLTGFEEAQSFKQYYERKGKGSIPELAQRIGKSPGYIRRKIAVLSLPPNIVKAWEKEELKFSHLEQLRRLKNKEELKEAFEYATGARFGRGYIGHAVSKRDLKEHIDNMAPSLDKALFDTKEEGCGDCHQNSDVQQKLWEIEGMEGVHCLNKACFKQKQNNFLLKNWKQSKYRRRFGTNGFRFSETTSWQERNVFCSHGTRPAKKCKTCEHYLSLIHLDGSIEEGRACFGEESCYNNIGRQSTVEKTQTERKKREESGGPRVTWHAQHFREEFLKKRFPERYQEFGHSHLKIVRMALFAFVKSDHDLLYLLKRETKLKNSSDDHEVFKIIAKMELDEIQELMKQCALLVIMKPWPVQHAGRLTAAAHLGIDLMKEFAVTEEYLNVKTIREMLDFGEKSGIFKSKMVRDYLEKTLKKKPGKFESCKKTELIDLFLKSGVNLVGKVPDEIVPAKEK